MEQRNQIKVTYDNICRELRKDGDTLFVMGSDFAKTIQDMDLRLTLEPGPKNEELDAYINSINDVSGFNLSVKFSF